MIIISSPLYPPFVKRGQDFPKMGIIEGYKKIFQMGRDAKKGKGSHKKGNGNQLKEKQLLCGKKNYEKNINNINIFSNFKI